MRYRRIPDETIKRLPVYLRGAIRLAEESVRRASSKELAEAVGVNPWQIRKDFSYFGGFGTPGVGYDIDKLIRQIRRILRLDVTRRAALVGVGNLGAALLAFPRFALYGLEIAAAFDIDNRKIGTRRSGVVIEDVAGLQTIKQRGIDLGIITVPGGAAQEVADKLVGVGIRGILNFSSRYITVPRTVKVITIDIAMDLARLSYYLPSG